MAKQVKPVVIEGTKSHKERQAQVVSGSKDPRQIRCPKCRNLAVATPDGKGGTVTACGYCGAKFKSSLI
jgi:hypothetical protein